jgi:mono/diheme cytochrome c family protein
MMVEYEIQKGRNQPVKFIAGLLLGLVLVPLGIYMYLTSGSAPVATTDSDLPFETFLAHKALNARIAKEMPKIVPVQTTEPNYLAGAELYQQHCGVCHGLPLSPKTAIATGMYPHPPQLFQGKGVTDDEPGETFWKISNGIRLTGMPGFSKSLSETQMWQVAILLANADKLPSSAKAALVAPPPPSVAPATTLPAAVTPPASPAPVPPSPNTAPSSATPK